MSWLLVTTAVTAVLLLALGYAWGGRLRDRPCPSCGVPFDVVGPAGHGPNGTYDVLACPRCTNTAVRVHGTLRRWAPCPACRQRTLEAHSVRAPEGGARVLVQEQCHLCGHAAQFTLGPEPLPTHKGQVIPFPKNRARG